MTGKTIPEGSSGQSLPWLFHTASAYQSLPLWHEDPDFLKTKNPAYIAADLMDMLSRLGVRNAMDKVSYPDSYSILGARQSPGGSRPNFYCEFPGLADPSLILHADFEKVRFILTVRPSPESAPRPEDPKLYQIDEAELHWLAHDQTIFDRSTRYVLNCGRDPKDYAILCRFIGVFSNAVNRIALMGEDNFAYSRAGERAYAHGNDIVDMLCTLEDDREFERRSRERFKKQSPQQPGL